MTLSYLNTTCAVCCLNVIGLVQDSNFIDGVLIINSALKETPSSSSIKLRY